MHDSRYVEAVHTGVPRHLAESQGFEWDPGLWSMVLSSNGGAVAAALDALERGVSGSLSSGLHHARRDHGAGFCTFNGLVIAARAALEAGAGSVLVLDLDAHCGGGTASLIAADPRIWQTDVAVCSFDYYQSGAWTRAAGDPGDAGDSSMAGGRAVHAQTWLRVTQRATSYVSDIERGLEELERRGRRFDLCIYNAGMDPFEGCSTGGLPGVTRDLLAIREQLVFEWCHEHVGAVAFVLAGGYVGWGLDAAGLVDLHRLTVAAAARTSRDPGPAGPA